MAVTDQRLMVRTLGALLLGLGVATAAWTVQPSAANAQPGGVLVPAGAFVLAGVLLCWVRPEAVPRWTVHALGLSATSLVCMAIVTNQAPAAGFGLFLLWTAPHAVCFFSRGAAVAHVTVMAAGYLGALWVQQRPEGQLHVLYPEDTSRWTLTVATVAALGMVFRYLYRRLMASEANVRHQALHDALTGLPNRTLFQDRLGHALERGARTGRPVAVLLCDLDGFKHINDTHGHPTGDVLLAMLGARLRAHVRPGDTVARLGGDEFVVLCEDVESELQALSLARRLTGVWREPFELGAGETFLHGSVGVAVSQGQHSTVERLMQESDAAMYSAKRAGRAQVALFDKELRAEVSDRLRMESDLSRAVERDQLTMVYQPIVETATGVPRSVEALLRWHHPQRGDVSPSEFIPVAEEAGLIGEMGEWALNEACAQVADWQRRSGKPIAVAVNVSGRQLSQPGLVEQVAAAVERSGLLAGTLSLEVTESVLMEHVADPVPTLHALREAGATVMLDDFGTGYSSLARLHGLPLDALKVDQSFVRRLDSRKCDAAIVCAVMQMADALGLSVVAEGVETVEQQCALAELGCPRAQGYLFSRPLPGPEAAAHLEVPSVQLAAA